MGFAEPRRRQSRVLHSFWLAQITQPLLDKVLAQLRANGSQVEPMIIIPPRPAWKVNGSGVIASVLYDSVNQRALVQIDSKPFLVPVSYVEQQVREAVRQARG